MSAPAPRVAVIVVNWNRRDETLTCLASLAALDSAPAAVIAVDNGSQDGSAAAIRAAYPAVTLIEAGSNLGFAAGSNAGLERALRDGADYALLLNNDATVAPDALRRLVEVVAADGSVGAVGPTIHYADRPDVIWSAGGAIDWRQGRTRMLALDEVDRGQLGTVPRPVDFVSGCCLLVTRAAIERAGRLDERFFAYYEEVEWCVRMGRAGLRILHVPGAHARHAITPAAQAMSPIVHYYMTRNRLLFLEAVRAPRAAWVRTLLCDYSRTLAAWTLLPRWRGMRGQRAVMLRAIADYFRRRFGRAPLFGT